MSTKEYYMLSSTDQSNGRLLERHSVRTLFILSLALLALTVVLPGVIAGTATAEEIQEADRTIEGDDEQDGVVLAEPGSEVEITVSVELGEGIEDNPLVIKEVFDNDFENVEASDVIYNDENVAVAVTPEVDSSSINMENQFDDMEGSAVLLNYSVVIPDDAEVGESFAINDTESEVSKGDTSVTPTDPDEIEAQEANFDVKIDESTPDEVVEGDSITVDYTIENTGKLTDTQDIVFTVDDSEEESEERTVDGEETFTGSFTYETEEPGNLTVSISSDDDSDEQEVDVLAAAAPELFELNIAGEGDSAEIAKGDDVDIDVEVENTGDVEGTFDVELTIDNGEEVTESQDVNLAGGATQTVTFADDTGELSDGKYTVSIESDGSEVTGDLSVIAQPELDDENSEVTPAEVTTGDEDDYTVEVELDSIAGVDEADVEVTLVEYDTNDNDITETVEGADIDGDTAKITVEGGAFEDVTAPGAGDYEVEVTIEEFDTSADIDTIESEKIDEITVNPVQPTVDTGDSSIAPDTVGEGEEHDYTAEVELENLDSVTEADVEVALIGYDAGGEDITETVEGAELDGETEQVTVEGGAFEDVTAPDAGEYEVEVTVTDFDSDGNVDTIESEEIDQITVNAQPTVDAEDSSIAPDTVNEGERSDYEATIKLDDIESVTEADVEVTLVGYGTDGDDITETVEGADLSEDTVQITVDNGEFDSITAPDIGDYAVEVTVDNFDADVDAIEDEEIDEIVVNPVQPTIDAEDSSITPDTVNEGEEHNYTAEVELENLESVTEADMEVTIVEYSTDKEGITEAVEEADLSGDTAQITIDDGEFDSITAPDIGDYAVEVTVDNFDADVDAIEDEEIDEIVVNPVQPTVNADDSAIDPDEVNASEQADYAATIELEDVDSVTEADVEVTLTDYSDGSNITERVDADLDGDEATVEINTGDFNGIEAPFADNSPYDVTVTVDAFDVDVDPIDNKHIDEITVNPIVDLEDDIQEDDEEIEVTAQNIGEDEEVFVEIEVEEEVNTAGGVGAMQNDDDDVIDSFELEEGETETVDVSEAGLTAGDSLTVSVFENEDDDEPIDELTTTVGSESEDSEDDENGDTGTSGGGDDTFDSQMAFILIFLGIAAIAGTGAVFMLKNTD